MIASVTVPNSLRPSFAIYASVNYAIVGSDNGVVTRSATAHYLNCQLASKQQTSISITMFVKIIMGQWCRKVIMVTGLWLLAVALHVITKLTFCWRLRVTSSSQKEWPHQWSNEQIMTLYSVTCLILIIPTTTSVSLVPYSSPLAIIYQIGDITLAAIAGTSTVFGLDHCDSFEDWTSADLICRCLAFKWPCGGGPALVGGGYMKTYPINKKLGYISLHMHDPPLRIASMLAVISVIRSYCIFVLLGNLLWYMHLFWFNKLCLSPNLSLVNVLPFPLWH